MCYAIVLSLLVTTINHGDVGPLAILRKVRHNYQIYTDQFQYAPRFYAHASLIRFRFRNGDTAKMYAWGGWGELNHYSVFALLVFYWNVQISLLFCFQWITYSELSKYKYLTKTKIPRV